MAVTRFKILQDGVSATGNGSSLDLAGASMIYVQVIIATTATVTFEVSMNNTNWVALLMTDKGVVSTTATTATTSKSFSADIRGCRFFRARVSAWTSGAVTVIGGTYNET